MDNHLTSRAFLRHGKASQLRYLAAIYLTIAALTAAAVAFGQSPERELLNSERIEQRFGSYGVEVLAQDSEVRVSNLYSGAEGASTCRTFAVVRYPPRIDPLLADAHAAIVAGGSIGAVFTAQGWQVRKTHLHYGELRASATLAGLMHVASGARLAAHVYVLDVVKDEQTREYAALVEIHHPEYLRVADLESIYGPIEHSRADLVSAMLTLAAERSR
jgi:hypothetical protein